MQVTKTLLSQGCIVAVLDHSLDDTDLVGQTLLALGDMLIRLSKVLAFLLLTRHGLLVMRLITRARQEIRVIPACADQNPWAQSRRPIDMMSQGWSMSLLQASQQWSRMSL